ncbi:MAG: hypothetical protein IJU36_07220 [Paludibacteraceae bacterium]|nr:hypothetical protein [Paludibacteraceae bacterium]
MKNLKFNFKSIVQTKARWLLTFCALLTLGVGQVWAWNVVEGKVYYFNAHSDWAGASAKLYVAFGNSGTTYAWDECKPVSGVANTYYVVSPGNYDWMIFTRQNPNSSGLPKWDAVWNQTQSVSPNTNYNYFPVNGTPGDKNNYGAWAYYAPPMESASLSKNCTTYGGTGTSSDPYLIGKNTKLRVDASSISTVTSDSQTKYYTFYKKENNGSRTGWDSRGTDTYKELTTENSVNYTYEIDVVAQNEYYGTYGTASNPSSVMYFKTIDPIYAILGEFNSWSHSAATWDLINQGDGTWEASFDLDAGSYEFQVVYASNYYGKSTTVSRASNSANDLATSSSNITLTADFDGTYIFTYNPSGYDLTVTYPSAHTVTYGVGTIAGCASVTPTPSFSSGALQLDATSITFAKSETLGGYTWKGWYNNASGSGEAISTADADFTSSSRDADYSIYACYTENNYTVSVVSSSATAGSVGSGSVTGHVTTSAALPTATPNTGYYFVNWEVTTGTATITNSTSATGATINGMTADCTVRANFAPIWALTGNTDEMGNWSSTAHEIENITIVDGKTYGFEELTLYPNRDYNFRIRDNQQDDGSNNHRYSVSGDMTYTNCANWQLYANQNSNSNIKTAGYGTYRFTWNITDKKLTVTYPESSILTLDWGHVEIDALSTINSGNTGGSVTAQTNEGSGFAITNGQYVANGSNITFTAAPATGYTLEGWYSNSDYAEGNKISTEGNYAIDGNTLTVSSISADLAIYAKFVETSTAVTIAHNEHGHVTIGGVIGTSTTTGVTTTRTITAVPDAGYYFAGWTLSDGADFTLDDNTGDEDSEVTMHGIGAGTASSLTANFVELEKIYFRNWNEGTSAPLWSDVYVYFSIYTEKSGDDDCAKSNVDVNYFTQMNQVGSTNIYWAYVPRGTTKNSDRRIAFSNHNFGPNFKFQNYEASMRNDYNKTLNMFVPYRTVKSTKNGTKYYDDGYWKTYGNLGEKSGYYINRWNGSAYVNPASKGTGDDFQFVITGENTIEYELRIDNLGNDHNSYDIVSLVGTKYNTSNSASVGTAITMSNCETGLELHDYQDNPRFSINPSSYGIYKITIDQSSDKMKIYVNYPVMLNDYRIKHTYTIDAKTYTAYSDILKNSQVSSGVTASMYINTNSSPTLTLEKCTAITPSVTWTAQTQGDVWSTHSSKFNSGNGVYKFDVAINTSTNEITSITNSGIYDGEFYIKTDIAPGGWTAWKANIMEKNSITFDSDDPKTYDYAFCHWVGNTTTNVKCVIANEYNIAVSDTLESDAILGGTSQTLPSAAHVRFSYNSTTNELKRTYLAVSGDDHLVMEGNTITSGSTVYMIHDNTDDDGAAFANNKATLDNLSNFTFGLDIKAREKARVRLSAKYNNVVQNLVGNTGTLEGENNANTVEIMGGDIAHNDYNILHVSYDFKTNQLLSAWLAPSSGTTPNKTINADVMIIRQEQGDAHQITFSGSNKLSEVKKVYGVMKFTKTFILNNGVSRYARDLYWISFPFDVRLSDAFGLGTYGTHWIIERYDGKTRAQNGFWADSPSNWKFITPYQRDSGWVLNANEGYILALDLDELGEGSLVWDNSMTEAYLYFPSKDKVNSIAPGLNKSVTIDQNGYQCTIGPRFAGGDDRRIKDSYWHCIGVPSYANIRRDVTNSDPTGTVLPAGESWTPTDLMYVYRWEPSNNTLRVHTKTDTTFKAMHSYLVQYSGETLTWAYVNQAEPASIAARLAETPDREYKLVLQGEERTEDQTFVRLTDETAVSNRFEFNQDLSKEYNAGRGNIWTVTADTVEVAGNSMPKPLQTTLVPVGVKVVANGEYTLTMPEGTNGEDVYLIDNAYGTRTNLGLMPYTVTLTAGTYDSRFALEFAPIQDSPTSLENDANANANANANADVRKVFVGGRLYIIRDSKVYDAAGQRVE